MGATLIPFLLVLWPRYFQKDTFFPLSLRKMLRPRKITYCLSPKLIC